MDLVWVDVQASAVSKSCLDDSDVGHVALAGAQSMVRFALHTPGSDHGASERRAPWPVYSLSVKEEGNRNEP